MPVSRVHAFRRPGGENAVSGLLCPADRTLVSGGFDVIHNDLKIVESFIGPGFGLPRVYIVFVTSFTGAPVPAGDMARMWATCL